MLSQPAQQKTKFLYLHRLKAQSGRLYRHAGLAMQAQGGDSFDFESKVA